MKGVTDWYTYTCVHLQGCVHIRENTQTCTYIQPRDHTDTNTQTRIHTQRSENTAERTHTRAHKQYTVKGVCTQGREHTDTYTQMCTYTHTLRNEYAAERTQAFQKYGNKCYLKKQKANTKKDKRKKKAKPIHNLWKLQLWRQGPASLAEREAGPFVEQILLLTVTFQSSVCGPGRFLFSVLFTLSINEQGKGGLRQCLIG